MAGLRDDARDCRGLLRRQDRRRHRRTDDHRLELGGVVGPLIAAALIGEDKNSSMVYTILGIIALVAVALPCITKPQRLRQSADEGYLGERSVA